MAKKTKPTAKEHLIAKAKRRIESNQRKSDDAEREYDAILKDLATDTAYQNEILKAVGEVG